MLNPRDYFRRLSPRDPLDRGKYIVIFVCLLAVAVLLVLLTFMHAR